MYLSTGLDLAEAFLQTRSGWLWRDGAGGPPGPALCPAVHRATTCGGRFAPHSSPLASQRARYGQPSVRPLRARCSSSAASTNAEDAQTRHYHGPPTLERLYSLGMAYLRSFLRLVAIGKIYDVEDFSFSMSLIRTGGLTDAPDEVPAEIIAAFTTFWGEDLISSYCDLTTLKLNLIGEDGRYVYPTTVQHDFLATGLPGGKALVQVPQVAYCVSLSTAAVRGPASKGRFYLPMPAWNVDIAGVLNSGTVAAFQTITDTLLQDLNDWSPDWQLGITSNVGGGAERAVTNARYGRVLDTIRSRRDKFSEEYVTGTTLTP